MYTVHVNLKNGTTLYRAAILTTKNHGRTRKPALAWRGSLKEAMDEASRLNSTFLELHKDVLFYSEGRLRSRKPRAA